MACSYKKHEKRHMYNFVCSFFPASLTPPPPLFQPPEISALDNVQQGTFADIFESNITWESIYPDLFLEQPASKHHQIISPILSCILVKVSNFV